MKSVTVVMSAYNGEKYIERQLDTIFAQDGVDVKCYVRDDGSKDNTVKILQEYKSKKQPARLSFSAEPNVGWQKSFLLALKDAPSADYYAFSDQDDIWFPDKLTKCIEELKKHDNNKVLMVHHNRQRVDSCLNPLPDTSIRVPRPLNRQNATLMGVQGCTAVFNEQAKKLFTKRLPKVNIPHDQWICILSYYFGEIYWLPEPLMYHIQYGSNTSSAGNAIGGQMARLKSFFAGGPIYENPADDVLIGYGDMIDDKSFLIRLRDYKINIRYRLQLFFSPQFRRISIPGTVMLKIAILTGKI